SDTCTSAMHFPITSYQWATHVVPLRSKWAQILLKHIKTCKQNQAHTVLTTSAKCCAWRITTDSSSPSTITRTNGSVPDLRNKTRPRPAIAAVTSSQAACTCG